MVQEFIGLYRAEWDMFLSVKELSGELNETPLDIEGEYCRMLHDEIANDMAKYEIKEPL